MEPLRPEYSTPNAPTIDLVRIERYSDGGVTVYIAPRPARQQRRDIQAIALAIATFIALMVLWINGKSPSTVSTTLFQTVLAILQGIQASPFTAVMILFPLSVWMLVEVIRYRRKGAMVVIGISPKTVFVENPTSLFWRRFEVPRSDLETVTIVFWTRTLTHKARCVSLNFRDCIPISICHNYPESTIQLVAQTLQESIASPHTEGG
jgi:hypothetical protein